MTPTQLDHLSRIKRHLETLLANAEKRTPGEWNYDDDSDDLDSNGGWVYAPDRPLLSKGDATHSTMAFIASCAGNAEKGWKSTLAAIDLCIANLHTDPEFPTHAPDRICDNNGLGCRACGCTERILLDPILAAWPIEKLP